MLLNVTPWRNNLCDYGHFVYKCLKQVQNFHQSGAGVVGQSREQVRESLRAILLQRGVNLDDYTQEVQQGLINKLAEIQAQKAHHPQQAGGLQGSLNAQLHAQGTTPRLSAGAGASPMVWRFGSQIIAGQSFLFGPFSLRLARLRGEYRRYFQPPLTKLMIINVN
jgi:hypothetical protein